MANSHNILIVDTETDGVAKTDNIIEAAYILYDYKHKVSKSGAYSLFKCEHNPLERINGIKPEWTSGVGRKIKEFFDYVIDNQKFDYVVAHNYSFDKRFLDKYQVKFNAPWLCSYYDFEWPKGNKKLTEIAIDMDVPIYSAHRAMADCEILARCFGKVDDLEKEIESASKPKKMFFAEVSYEDRELAKEAGFKFNGDLKLWVKKMTDKEIKEFKFKVRELEK